MVNIQSIYKETILPLPKSERLRLADLILEEAARNGDSTSLNSALQILNDLPNERLFQSAEDVDRHLESERKSWDN